MSSLFLLIPISVIVVFGLVFAIWVAFRSGQMDDMEGPAYRLLMDEEIFEDKDK